MNPGGIGTEVVVFYGDSMQKTQEYPVRGYISSVDPVLHFGLGNRKTIDSLKVTWPDGMTQMLHHLETHQRITLAYTDAKKQSIKKRYRYYETYPFAGLPGSGFSSNP